MRMSEEERVAAAQRDKLRVERRKELERDMRKDNMRGAMRKGKMEATRTRMGRRKGRKDNCRRTNGAGKRKMRRTKTKVIRALAEAGKKRRRMGGGIRTWTWNSRTTQTIR